MITAAATAQVENRHNASWTQARPFLYGGRVVLNKDKPIPMGDRST